MKRQLTMEKEELLSQMGVLQLKVSGHETDAIRR